MSRHELIQKLHDRSAVIAIIGMGYVGLPLMLRFNGEGYRVIGIDNDHEKVQRLNRGESYTLIVDTRGVYLEPAENVVKA